MAGVTGLEPATYGVTGRRSNQTELHPRDKKCLYRYPFCFARVFFIYRNFFQVIRTTPEKPDIPLSSHMSESATNMM